MSNSVLSKPNMRGLLASSIKRHLTIAVGMSLVSGVVYYYTVCEPRKQRYADFYKNYDAEEDFKRMKALGVFQSG